MENPRISLVMPCYKRPQRTRRMVECISKQTINNFEAFIIGDGCSDFEQLLNDSWYQDKVKQIESKGNRIVTFNMDRNYGGYGYAIMNYARQNCTGNYLVFTNNDDMITDDHLQYYLSEIEGTDYDMVHYNSLVIPKGNTIRNSQLKEASIGHSEIIVTRDLARRMPPHTPDYIADWFFISNAMQSGAKIKKSKNTLKTTYMVMSIDVYPGRLDTYID